MPGLDPTIVQHHLPILPHARPVKQKLRRLHPRLSLQVKEEIQKQLSVGFLSVVEYPEWLANVVPVPKKDGKVRVCVNFRDLNKASPKDDFPLPHIDMLVDSTTRHPMLSFMDGFSGYNQILMALEGKDFFHHRVGYLLLSGHAIWVKKIQGPPIRELPLLYSMT